MDDAFVKAMMSMGLKAVIFTGFLSFVFSVVFWLLMRPVLLWYFKIDLVAERLTEIRDLLIENTSAFPSSGLESDNIREGIIETPISPKVSLEPKIKAEIKPKINPDQVLPTSSWNVDKPMMHNQETKSPPKK